MAFTGKVRRELGFFIAFLFDQLAPAGVVLVWIEACEVEPPIGVLVPARASIAVLSGLIAGALARGEEIKIGLAAGAASLSWGLFRGWRRSGELALDPISVVIVLCLFGLGAWLAGILRHRRSRDRAEASASAK